jgi:hypothetical protein
VTTAKLADLGVTTAKLADGSVTGAKLDATLAPQMQDFRLSLTSGTPVTTSDVTGATTIYLTPYKGNRIGLYSGTAWVSRNTAEISVALGTLTSGKPYDIFCYDNSGAPALEILAWTSDTARATALVYQDGVLVKSGAPTRRYIGTFYTTSTTATEDSVLNRYLWNYNNRVDRIMARNEATATWSYSTATLRQANSSTSNQLNFIVGVAEDATHVWCTSALIGNNTNDREGTIAIGYDSTTAATSRSAYASTGNSGTTRHSAVAYLDHMPAVGRHYYSWLEAGAGTDTQTWYGGVIGGIGGSIKA